MPAATVLFVDVVGFSSRGSDDQISLTHTLNEALRALLGRWHAPHSRESDVIALPTGDGAAIVFVEGESRPWRFDDVVRIAYGLTRWAAANGAQICAWVGRGKTNAPSIVDNATIRRPNASLISSTAISPQKSAAIRHAYRRARRNGKPARHSM